MLDLKIDLNSIDFARITVTFYSVTFFLGSNRKLPQNVKRSHFLDFLVKIFNFRLIGNIGKSILFPIRLNYLYFKLNFYVLEKLTQGTSLILAVTKGETGASAVKLSRDIITALDGPNHVSETIEQAQRDIISAFPDFNIPKVTLSAQLRDSVSNKEDKTIERTLTIITPTGGS